MTNEKMTLKERWNNWWYAHGDDIATSTVIISLGALATGIWLVVGAAMGQQALEESMAQVDPEGFKEMMKKLGEKDAEEIIQRIVERASEEK